ncbi:hypothetical protein B0H39_000835 [Clostridium beijerinckii]|uniref:endonuclease NucS domain-containing protein n=1 Tax=Clostridium beijerinckii TaxID=1520 RepID=UPI0014940007|nr:endonuclease NucS domain-containing protein [Clostridium beijerinckii]NOW82954.1 hypothetical protein [Clostridium beijerinckii]
MELIKVNLKEVQELEPLVINTLKEIEEGLRLLKNQLSIGGAGRPDILAVDPNGTLVILELKSVTADPYAISQVVRYYEWAVQTLALIARPYPEIKPDKGVRLFLVAPEFSEETIRIGSYLNLDLSLIKYTAIKDKKTNDIGILYEELQRPPIEELEVKLRSIEDIITYFSDNKLAEEFRKVLEYLSQKGVVISTYNGGKDFWIECSTEDEFIAYFQPRKRYFNCQIYNEDLEKFIWPPIKLTSFDEWNEKCEAYISKYIVEKDDV